MRSLSTITAAPAKRRHLEARGATRARAASEDLPPSVVAGTTHARLCRWGTADSRDGSGPVGSTVDAGCAPLRGPAAPRDGPGRAPRSARRDRAGDGEDREPVRAAHGHRAQGGSRHVLRPQGQPRHRAQRAGARRGGGDRQSTGQYTLSGHARAPSRALRCGAVARRLRRRLRDTRQPRAGPRPSASSMSCSTRRAASSPRI